MDRLVAAFFVVLLYFQLTVPSRICLHDSTVMMRELFESVEICGTVATAAPTGVSRRI
jgi:hypothetical protein